MDLFDDSAQHLPQLGFRLQRLEVYNWGTFDGEVWTLDLAGATSLLTGDVGSGKSTLVDAIITLLVPPRRVTYNKAADASAKERSLNSYVRGYYAHHSTAEGGSRPEALRDKNEYSVILGVFADENYGRTVTLAQIFWYKTESAATPARLYVLADKTLSIADRFSRISDMRALRRRLEADDFIHTYDDYPLYGRDFCKRFGIRQMQALDLFQQTISLKKVDSLTAFVRANMLEPPDAEGLVAGLLQEFSDLEAAHTSVVRAREQQRLLAPVREAGRRYRALESNRAEAEQMMAALPAWMAQQDAAAVQALRATEAAAHDALSEAQSKLRAEQQAAEAELSDVRTSFAQNGGARLTALQGKIAAAQEKQAAREEDRKRYTALAESLGLSVPEDAAAFSAQAERIAAIAKEQEEALDAIGSDIADQQGNLKEVTALISRIEGELASLANRRSNIPTAYVRLRDELADDLGLAATEMPFVGELLEVKPEEAAWEGALERLLHGFGLSLLVPEVHYGEVADWMEHHRLSVRLVYYSVADGGKVDDFGGLPDDAACCKLNIRRESPLAPWLTQELAHRYAHHCTENLRDFRRTDYAIKKDDRHAIDDRRTYVLGFSNLRKVEALKAERENQEIERKDIQSLLRKAKARQKKARTMADAAAQLAGFSSFDAIDSPAVAHAIAKLRDEEQALREENRVYHELRRKEAALQRQLDSLRQAAADHAKQLARSELVLEQLDAAAAADQAELSRMDALALAKAAPLLAAHATGAWGSRTFSHEARQELQNLYQNHLADIMREAQQAVSGETSALAAAMESFNQTFPELARNLAPRPEALAEYEAVLDRLERDGLPAYEQRFRELLQENTVHQMALFYANLKLRAKDIQQRIGRINASLREIDYNPGRYIEISCVHTHVRAVQEFRRALDACMKEDAAFEDVAALARRLRADTDEDARWRREVVDVRNWFDFAASECWRETGEEYEHYTDSGGKSGGQKEKLAYTILAASIVYNFGLEGGRFAGEQSFRFVVIDEAFLKSSDASAQFGLELFQKLDLQLLVVTPLLKIATIEPYVERVGFVWQDDAQHRSFLRNIRIEELSSC
ncbi:ATP-binding protein [uncultured Selenomonas sp.]|uniref:ATP-binding protein n=1 Tax=uncultured Selenomonas sp. TaxID=159275 RepID=UPI0025DF0F33|nr:ATP-binding protein [uncultured Selenomonas sp.]